MTTQETISREEIEEFARQYPCRSQADLTLIRKVCDLALKGLEALASEERLAAEMRARFPKPEPEGTAPEERTDDVLRRQSNTGVDNCRPDVPDSVRRPVASVKPLPADEVYWGA